VSINLGASVPNLPCNYAVASSGKLFITKAGASYRMIKYDGFTTSPVGMTFAPLRNIGVTFSGPATGGTGTNVVNGLYTVYMRFKDNEGNVSNVGPTTTATATANNTVTYTNLDLPTDFGGDPTYATRVTNIQILRSTAGESTVFYIEADVPVSTIINRTLALTPAVISGTNPYPVPQPNPPQTATDAQLVALTTVPSTSLFNFTRPPSWKRVIQSHLGRMFAAVDAYSNGGNVQVTNGSSTVNIIGGFVDPFQTQFLVPVLFVTGATQPYSILAGLNPLQTSFQLGAPNATTNILGPTNYADSTNSFAAYSIRPAITERKLVYWSLANLPDAWPAANSLAVQEDGDELTGLMSFSSYLYILERHHIYRFTFFTDPAVDGAVFLALNRGCINQRCWVLVENYAYLLDDQGIYAFDGRAAEPISTAIQDIFRFSDSPLRVNWTAQEWFHAVHYAPQETIRWFVTLSGSYLPYHAICYNYRQKRWWIESWPVPVGASALGRVGKDAKTPQVYLGSDHNRILAMWQGPLDGPQANEGRVRGMVTLAGFDSLTDSTAQFASAHLVNNSVSIVDGTGRGQQRVVRAVSGQTIKVKQPWLIQPDSTSVYQLGGVQWQTQFGWWRWIWAEEHTERFLTVVAQSLPNPAIMTAQLFTDFGSVPVNWKGAWTLADGNGVRTTPGSPNIDFDLTKGSGYYLKRMPGHREFFSDGTRYISWRLSGVTNVDFQRIYYVIQGGADQGG